jgi:hypothetical protein
MAKLHNGTLCSACRNILCERKYEIYIVFQIAYIYNWYKNKLKVAKSTNS